MKMELVLGPLESWFAFLRQNFMELFKKLLIVNLYVYGVILVALLVSGLLLWFGMSAGAALAAVLGIIIVLPVAALAAGLFYLAAYRIVDEEHGQKKPVGITAVAGEKILPFLAYAVASGFIFVVALVPFLILGFLLGGASLLFSGEGGVQLVSEFFQAVIALIGVAIAFFLQFALFEIVVAGRGGLQSVGASFSLVRKNFLETAVFFLIKSGIAGIVQLPFSILLFVLVLGGLMLLVPLSTLSTLFAYAGLVLGAVILILYLLIMSSVDDTVMLPLTYQYWKAIRGEGRTGAQTKTRKRK